MLYPAIDAQGETVWVERNSAAVVDRHPGSKVVSVCPDPYPTDTPTIGAAPTFVVGDQFRSKKINSMAAAIRTTKNSSTE